MPHNRIPRVPLFKVIRARVYGINGDFRFFMDVRYIPEKTIQGNRKSMIDAGEMLFYSIIRKQKAYMRGMGSSYPRSRDVIFDNGVIIRY